MTLFEMVFLNHCTSKPTFSFQKKNIQNTKAFSRLKWKAGRKQKLYPLHIISVAAVACAVTKGDDAGMRVTSVCNRRTPFAMGVVKIVVWKY
jgi:hypothetical protein